MEGVKERGGEGVRMVKERGGEGVRMVKERGEWRE